MTEEFKVPGRRLGLLPTDPNRPVLHLSSFLSGKVPAHPAAADHFAKVSNWGLWGNDQYGDCGPVSVGNQRLLTTEYLATETTITEADVFDLYRRSGNDCFDPASDACDNGVDMATMLQAVHTGGMAGVKCVAYAKVNVNKIDEVRAAIDIFGSVLFGVNLEVAQQTQTNSGIWDYSPSGMWGGHAIVAGKYTSAAANDISVVTWAEVVGCTDAFLSHQLSECWVVIWPEQLGTAEFQQGINLAQLAADYKALTGSTLPTPTPTPTPTPSPSPSPSTDPLSELAGMLRKFSADIAAWLQAHGL
jgi:hypothetical protein